MIETAREPMQSWKRLECHQNVKERKRKVRKEKKRKNVRRKEKKKIHSEGKRRKG